MQGIIHVEDLSLSYNDVAVVWDIDLDIEKNTLNAIVGPNGAGKSTLLKGILGILKPLTGRVSIMGMPISKALKNITYIPQSANVNWDFPTTVFDVVLMGRYKNLGYVRRPKENDKKIAMEALERMGMTSFKDRQISELSGGQKQRVFLARAICGDCDIYFLDEPLTGVDAVSEKVIMDTLKDFQKEGKTVVAVHHDLTTLNKYFDHVAIINRRLIAYGRVEDTLTKENIEKAYGRI